jgi:dihydropteroate synthase
MKNILIKSLILCATAVASEHLIVIDPGHGGSKAPEHNPHIRYPLQTTPHLPVV